MALVTCKDCGKEFSTDAKRCPNCGANPPKPPAMITCKGCGTAFDASAPACPSCGKKPASISKRSLLLGLGLLIAIGAVYKPKTPQEAAADAEAAASRKEVSDLDYDCEDAIRKKLKDPASAQFPNYRERLQSPVVVTKDGGPAIAVTVRAKNSFGAYVPSVFVCTVSKDSTGHFHVTGATEGLDSIATPGVGSGPTSTPPSHTPEAGGPTSTPTSRTASGKDVYRTNCAACHQANGKGMPPAFPTLVDNKIANGAADANIALVLAGKNLMPGFAQLSDVELAAAISYQRMSWGNKGGPIGPDQVAALRHK